MTCGMVDRKKQEISGNAVPKRWRGSRVPWLFERRFDRRLRRWRKGRRAREHLTGSKGMPSSGKGEKGAGKGIGAAFPRWRVCSAALPGHQGPGKSGASPVGRAYWCNVVEAGPERSGWPSERGICVGEVVARACTKLWSMKR